MPFMSQNCETLNIVIKMALCSMLYSCNIVRTSGRVNFDYLHRRGGGRGGNLKIKKGGVMHLKKKKIFCHHNFMKKGHSKLSKNEPENIS